MINFKTKDLVAIDLKTGIFNGSGNPLRHWASNCGGAGFSDKNDGSSYKDVDEEMKK